jgi:hypothetical protein
MALSLVSRGRAVAAALLECAEAAPGADGRAGCPSLADEKDEMGSKGGRERLIPVIENLDRLVTQGRLINPLFHSFLAGLAKNESSGNRE